MGVFSGEEYHQENIMERMLNRIPDNVDKREGSIVWDMLAPSSIELTRAYMELDHSIDLRYPDTSYGEHLDKLCKEVNIVRKQATKASGEVTFYGDNGVVIPQGTIVTNVGDGSMKYSTLNEVIIENVKITAEIECLTEGSVGNRLINEINSLESNINGVTNVSNESVLDNGYAIETDSEMLSRYYDRVKNPIASGNATEYKIWAREIEGVGDAKVIPLWNGKGTVKVIVFARQNQVPSPSLVETVRQKIELKRPMFADVSVVSVERLLIDVSLSVSIDEDQSVTGIKQKLTTNLSNYLVGITDGTVRYSKINEIIMSTDGVVDCINLKLNGSNLNIYFTEEQAPSLAGINII